MCNDTAREVAREVTPPEHSLDFGKPEDIADLWEKIGEIQEALEPFVPQGEMEISKVKVKYITKHQIENKLKELMSEHGVFCTYEGVKRIDVVKSYITYWDAKGGKEERPNLHLRYWVEYGLKDRESGATVFRVAPGDASGYDSKHSTVAMAFALRDFLSHVFLVSMDSDALSLEELQAYGADVVARKMGMEDLEEGLRVKAQFMVENVGTGPLQKKAKSINFKPSSWKLDEMSGDELWKLIKIGVDIVNPPKQKQALEAVIAKGKKEKEKTVKKESK